VIPDPVFADIESAGDIVNSEKRNHRLNVLLPKARWGGLRSEGSITIWVGGLRSSVLCETYIPARVRTIALASAFNTYLRYSPDMFPREEHVVETFDCALLDSDCEMHRLFLSMLVLIESSFA